MKGCKRIFVMSRPCSAPSVIAMQMMTMTATGAGQPHSVNIIEMSTPSRARTEPTERSMPPVMMTIPRPMLKMPYMPICRAVFCRLVGERNWGLSIATTMHSTTSRMNMPSSFFKAFQLLRLWILQPTPLTTRRSRRPLADGVAHDVLFGAFAALKYPCQHALVHDGHAVADVQDFLHVRGDHQNRHAVLGQVPHQRIN